MSTPPMKELVVPAVSAAHLSPSPPPTAAEVREQKQTDCDHYARWAIEVNQRPPPAMFDPSTEGTHKTQ